jgi:hypothetical protein
MMAFIFLKIKVVFHFAKNEVVLKVVSYYTPVRLLVNINP